MADTLAARTARTVHMNFVVVPSGVLLGRPHMGADSMLPLGYLTEVARTSWLNLDNPDSTSSFSRPL